ncbi:MAG: iron-containing alcohol dehydrogenase [Porticoccaceae bacterium]|nr:iron-containing alcohol dehydrogenase [Porticoccaceae bacterium]|tara:strand:+ start:247 stop:1404 length:1158 start_codon:yes stop_codon:yes gene_type:complete
MSTQIILPRILEIGAGASRKIGSMVKDMNCQRPLIVTDKIMLQLGYVERVQDDLRAMNIDSDVFDDTVPEPTTRSIEAGVELVKNGQYDVIIGLGGGSPIDSAKAISILGKYGGQMRDYKFPRLVTEPGLPIIAIPTTAGTGSEATRVTVITDDSNDEKMLCVGIGFMPTVALVDYELTLSVPARTTADTGIDALTHALEAYVSKKANVFSDIQAVAAMKLLAPNLRRVFNNSQDREAREAMMLGSTLAGVAFSNASVALVHGMSRPIGAFYHVPHGLSNAMLLPAVTEYSIPAAEHRYADAARAMGIAQVSDSDASANQRLMAELYAINRELEVPTPAEFGISRSQFFDNLSIKADQALASGSPANNPRVPSADDIIEIYKQLW